MAALKGRGCPCTADEEYFESLTFSRDYALRGEFQLGMLSGCCFHTLDRSRSRSVVTSKVDLLSVEVQGWLDGLGGHDRGSRSTQIQLLSEVLRRQS